VKRNVSLSLKLPKLARMALVAVGAVCVVGLGWMVLLGPKQSRISDLNQQTQQVRQQIADDLSRAADARGTNAAPTIKVADVYKLQTAMPSITDMPDLLLEIDQVARAAGVTIQSLQPDQPTPSTGGGYSQVTITLAVTSNFYSLTDFLYRIRNLVYVRDGTLQANGRIFTVNSIDLTPTDASIKANISLVTYVYGTASPTTAASAPTSTTTTPTNTTAEPGVTP